jgi:hypothetical protein
MELWPTIPTANMTKLNQKDQSKREAAVKKPYVKPSFERERVFETMALSCGKMGTTGSCHQNRKNS